MASPSHADYLKLLGLISVRMSNIETHMRNFISEMISDDYELNVRIMAGNSFTDLLRLLKSVFPYRVSEKKVLQQFDALAIDLSNLNDERAKYIHSDWTLGDVDGIAVAKRMKVSRHKRGLRVDLKQNEFELLQDFLDKVEVVIEKLTQLKVVSMPIYIAHRAETAKKPYMAWDKDGFPIRTPINKTIPKRPSVVGHS